MTPTPARLHQRVLARLHLFLESCVTKDAAVEVLFSPADIRLGPRTLVQPDLFLVSKPTDPVHDNWSDTDRSRDGPPDDEAEP